MGQLRNLTESIHEFATDYVEDEYDPAVAVGDGGYDTSTKIGLLLLKEEINKPLRRLEDYLNEMPGILGVFDLETSPKNYSTTEDFTRVIYFGIWLFIHSFTLLSEFTPFSSRTSAMSPPLRISIG